MDGSSILILPGQKKKKAERAHRCIESRGPHRGPHRRPCRGVLCIGDMVTTGIAPSPLSFEKDNDRPGIILIMHVQLQA